MLVFVNSLPSPIAMTAAAQGAHAQGDTLEDDGWRSLFNGEDLTGWMQLNGDHIYEARDGTIVGRTVPGQPNGFLVTEEEFGDFILELEVLVDPLMNNSGIQFRSLSYEEYQDGRVHGYQAEIDTKPQRWSGSIYDEARRGWLYILEINPEAKRAFVNNTWNHYRIEAIGTSNRVWVNGVPTSHLVDDETLRGFIGLQLHANNPYDPPGSHWIRFRNIRIRTENLEPAPPDDIFVVNLIPNAVSEPERTQGFELLFDGRSKNGWSAVGAADDAGGPGSRAGAAQNSVEPGSAAGAAENSVEPGWRTGAAERSVEPAPNAATTVDSLSGWTADDGTLRAAGSEGDDLVSNRSFTHYELKFEFRPHKEDATCSLHERDTGGLDTPERSTYCQMASRKIESDRWNQGVIRARPDGMVEYYLNGYKILEYWHVADPPALGRIRLEHDGGAVAYRSIAVRELD